MVSPIKIFESASIFFFLLIFSKQILQFSNGRRMGNSPVSRCQMSSDILLFTYPNFVRNVGKKTFGKIGVSREVCGVQFGKREI